MVSEKESYSLNLTYFQKSLADLSEIYILGNILQFNEHFSLIIVPKKSYLIWLHNINQTKEYLPNKTSKNDIWYLSG